MSKFDLEAAKRGDAVQYKSKDGQWKDTVLLATDLVIVKSAEASDGFVVSVSELRMKPRQREMWTYPRELWDENVMGMSELFLSEEAAYKSIDECKESGGIILGKPQMILVDEE